MKMSSLPANEIETWEDDGGASPRPLKLGPVFVSGTESQVEWSERIRLRVNNEFDRVAAAFQTVADNQDDRERADTEAIIAILEDKRAEVMRSDRAGYFIHDWQEIGDQVRQMIFADARYQAIKSHRPAGRR